MRQQAWYSAIPKGSNISRIDSLQDKKDKALNEDKLVEASPEEVQEIPFPELIEGSEYLVPLFYSAGAISHTGMGISPLTWQEIKAWSELIQRGLTAWELETIRKMSESYSTEYNLASDPQRERPYTPAVVEINREAVAQQLVSALSLFVKED